MVLSISALVEPVGSIKQWIRPDNSTPLPPGWLICDGSTVVDASSVFNGKALPDLRGRFARGHATLDNSNFAADTLYFTGGTLPTGGADSNDFAHTHVVANHAHTVNAHDHTFSATTSLKATDNNFQTVGPPPGATAAHDHTVSGTTGTATPGTSSDGPSATASSLAVIDNRPLFKELVTIIKVR
jgi:hypothetical protein